MLRFFLILMGLTIFRFGLLPEISADIVKKPQQICVKHIPRQTRFPEAYGAIVCGLNLPPGPRTYSLQASGLIHLLVVSGSHLIFLARLVHFAGYRNKWGLGFGLLVFALMSGLQPPALRAWFQIQMQILAKKYRWFCSTPQIVLISGLCCLLLFPDWIQSLSFILSWACSLALGLSKKKSFLSSSLHVYLVLFPILLTFGAPHPISILTNALFGEILGWVLFPITLLSFFVTPMVLVTDKLWSLLFEVLRPFETWPRSEPDSIPILLCWAFLMTLHTLSDLKGQTR